MKAQQKLFGFLSDDLTLQVSCMNAISILQDWGETQVLKFDSVKHGKDDHV